MVFRNMLEICEDVSDAPDRNLMPVFLELRLKEAPPVSDAPVFTTTPTEVLAPHNPTDGLSDHSTGAPIIRPAPKSKSRSWPRTTSDPPISLMPPYLNPVPVRSAVHEPPRPVPNDWILMSEM